MTERTRYIIEGARCEVERRDGVEGQWETVCVVLLQDDERSRIAAAVGNGLARRDRERAKRRIVEIDHERARLQAIIGDDDHS